MFRAGLPILSRLFRFGYNVFLLLVVLTHLLVNFGSVLRCLVLDVPMWWKGFAPGKFVRASYVVVSTVLLRCLLGRLGRFDLSFGYKLLFYRFLWISSRVA